MRKTIVALLALFTLAFAVGCSSSGGDEADDKETTTTAASGDETTTTEDDEETTTTEGGDDDALPVEEWAEGFCGSFEGWISEIQDASSGLGDSVSPGDIEGAKTAIVGLFDGASEQTQSLIDDLENGGVPDIEDGDQLVDDLIAKFQDFDDAITTARDEAEGLSTDDPGAFMTEVTALVTTFQTETTEVGDSFTELDTKYPSRELNDALQASCNF